MILRSWKSSLGIFWRGFRPEHPDGRKWYPKRRRRLSRGDTCSVTKPSLAMQRDTHEKCCALRTEDGISKGFHLLLHPKNRILCRLGDAEFQHRFGGNLELLFR